MAYVVQFLPLVLIFVIFYFMLIRPQQKRQKEAVAMQNALKSGDGVVTIGGLHGTIESVNDEQSTVTIKSVDGSRLVFDRNAIRQVKL